MSGRRSRLLMFAGVIPAALTGGLVLGLVVAQHRLRSAVREDHLIEWLQVGLFFCSALMLAVVVRRWAGHAELRVAAILGAIGAGGLLLIALEEISWGQRLFGFETPESMSGANAQGEFNLHNLEVMQGLRNYLPMLFAIFGLAGCALRVLMDRRSGRAWLRALLPSPVNLFTFCCCLAISIYLAIHFWIELGGEREPGGWAAGRSVSEWAELLVSYACFQYVYLKLTGLDPAPQTDAD